MGTVKKSSLADIMNNPESKKIQQEIEDGKCPNCWVESEIYRVINENLIQLLTFGISETIKNWLRVFKISDNLK